MSVEAPGTTAPRPGGSPPFAATEVEGFVARTASALRLARRHADADRLANEVGARARERPLVVVAGEAKRGKSSLVNALLGAPDLSPVGVEPTTGAPITFRASASPEAWVLRFVVDRAAGPGTSGTSGAARAAGTSGPAGTPDPRKVQPRWEPVALEQALRLATVAGATATGATVAGASTGADTPAPDATADGAAVRGVLIGWPSDLLQHLDLVDTPGVGGLDSGHGELTLQALGQADVLVFVTEAASPIRDPELRFLQRAASRIETVLIVMTKTDLARGWRQVLDDDIEVLRAQAPRFASSPHFAVSSRLAIRAARAGGPDTPTLRASALRDESGVSALHQALVDVATRHARDLRAANLLRMCVSALGVVEWSLLMERRAAAGEQSGVRALEAEQQRVSAFQRDQAEWAQELDLEMRRISIEHGEQLSQGLAQIRRRYDAQVRSASRAQLESLPDQVVAEITALAGRLNEMVADRVGRALDRLATKLGVDVELGAALSALPAHLPREQLDQLEIGATSMTAYDRFSVLSSFSSGHSVGSLLSGSSLGLGAAGLLGGPAGVAVALGLGALFAVHAFRARSQASFAAEFRPWMQDQVSRAQAVIANAYSRSMLECQAEARRHVQAALEAKGRALKAALETARAGAERDEAERKRAMAATDVALADIRGLRQEILDAIAALLEVHDAVAADAAASE